MKVNFHHTSLTDAYTRADVDYSWKKSAKNGIETVSEQLAQFDIVAISTRTKDIKNSKGEEECDGRGQRVFGRMSRVAGS